MTEGFCICVLCILTVLWLDRDFLSSGCATDMRVLGGGISVELVWCAVGSFHGRVGACAGSDDFVHI